MQAAIAVAILLAVLSFAVARPRRLPEAVVAAPAAALVVAIGLVPWQDALGELHTLAPTVGFLAAILVLAHLADVDGVFGYAGALAAHASKGYPQRLLATVFVVASLVTAVLSLDATVVLLTPVVFSTSALLRVRARPHVYACTHLANSASLLLPVSNLTNLLAYSASGLSFAGFTALMALPWLVSVGWEYVVFRRFFAGDLGAPPHPRRAAVLPPPPVFTMVVLAVTLLGFALAEPAGVAPAWVAAGGALVLILRRLAVQRHPVQRHPGRSMLTGVLRALNPAFLAFVFALGVVVLAVRRNGLSGLVGAAMPDSATLPALLAVAFVAAVLANVLNNLPATLVLVPAVAHRPGLVLAVLLGVNIGPNLTYVGSLATLLWRRVLHAHDTGPRLSEFLRLGATTVPAALVLATLALWAGLRIGGLT